MKKRILLIITSLAIILIIGMIYYTSYMNSIIAKSKYKSTTNFILEENITNTIANEINTVVSEIENNIVEENSNSNNNESIKEEHPETKQEKQIISPHTSTQTKQVVQPTKTDSTTKIKDSSSDTPVATTKPTTAAPVIKTQDIPTSTPTPPANNENTKKDEQKADRCTTNNNHAISVGNSSKWFGSRNEAIAYYNEKVKYWANKWENSEIDNDTYYKNCPSGYEIYSCMYCNKWTINFYYR